MNRLERRAKEGYARLLAKQPWAPLQRKALTQADIAWACRIGDFQEAWTNAHVSVQVYRRSTPWGSVRHLAVRRHDGGEIAGWDVLQRAKAEVCGERAVALEVYPAANDVMDHAPMRHLFVLPDGFEMPLTINRGHWR